MQKILDNLYLFKDTCNVYVIRNGHEAVLIDFGNGDVLDNLAEIGVKHVTDVLMTHHHRDQGQGLNRAADAGINICVPHIEQDLFQNINEHWQAREIYANYLMRQDRFSLLEPIIINGTLQDYEVRSFAGYEFTVVPTPGHTTGSISLMVTIDDTLVAFSGDLIAEHGKVWTLSGTQWSYNGIEGAAASIPSLLDLKHRQPALLLPSHGKTIDQPAFDIDTLVMRLWHLLQLRGQNRHLFEYISKPYERITTHLLRHRTSFANIYVLLSETHEALMIDFGYDFVTSLPSGSDRASRRPWLYSIPMLKQQYGIEKISAVVPTHYHDDHVAGINLLREVEGTQVWAAELFSDVLEHPNEYDLPCLWYDPIPVDRQLPLKTPIQWNEYTLILHPLPGHTRYAVAIEFEVDGKRVLATGDQYQGDSGLELNYVYASRFHPDEYIKSARLYRQVNPDIIITGHWKPLMVTPEYFDQLDQLGHDIQHLHQELLSDVTGLGDEGFLARLTPYQSTLRKGVPINYKVEIENPFAYAAEAVIKVILPKSWEVDNDSPTNDIHLHLDPLCVHWAEFTVSTPKGVTVRRARIAVDVTIDNQPFGQQAEALITII